MSLLQMSLQIEERDKKEKEKKNVNKRVNITQYSPKYTSVEDALFNNEKCLIIDGNYVH